MQIDPRKNLKIRSDGLARNCYKLTEKFPREELYVVTSQLRRAILSVPANIVEGYARNRSKVFLNHLEIAYASLAEAKYFIYFSFTRNYINQREYKDIIQDADEISRMLWSSITTVSLRINNDQ